MSAFINPADVESPSATARPDGDVWAGRPCLEFGPGKDGHLRILQHRHSELSERSSELSRRRYEASSGKKADHALLTRIDGERAQVELELIDVAAALDAESRKLAAA